MNASKILIVTVILFSANAAPQANQPPGEAGMASATTKH